MNFNKFMMSAKKLIVKTLKKIVAKTLNEFNNVEKYTSNFFNFIKRVIFTIILILILLIVSLQAQNLDVIIIYIFLLG